MMLATKYCEHLNVLEGNQRRLHILKTRIMGRIGNSCALSNVGGVCLRVNRDRIQQDALSSTGLPNVLISGNYERLLPCDTNGHTFLDLDVTLFVDTSSVTDRKSMKAVNQFFRLEQNDIHSTQVLPLTAVDTVCQVISERLTKDRNVELSTTLLYRGSRDGFTAKDFHGKCDQREATLLVVRDKLGRIFGAYADIAWRSSGGWRSSKNIFLLDINVTSGSRCAPFLYGVNKGETADTTMHMHSSGYDLVDLPELKIPSNCCAHNSCSLRLGNSSNSAPRNKFKFAVAEIEVYSVSLTQRRAVYPPSALATFAEQHNTLLSSSDGAATAILHLLQWERRMDQEILSIRDHLECVAKFVSVPLLGTEHVGSSKSSPMALHISALDEIEYYAAKLLLSAQKVSSKLPSARIVTINAGGTVLAVSEATLQQAPCGSLLANMASDVWGHDLDSDGNIVQDVNPKLFTAIINHLRLKALLPPLDVPPIVVHWRDVAELKSLLDFYTLEDVVVECL